MCQKSLTEEHAMKIRDAIKVTWRSTGTIKIPSQIQPPLERINIEVIGKKELISHAALNHLKPMRK